MKLSENKWTQSQLDAIRAKGGSILVSAAAGSGKTAVLVERVIQILTDKDNPCDADKLLVVTFTKAAAAEMRERISNKISDMLIYNPENKNLQRQQLILSHAHISTIHSFCNELIKDNFYKLNISPNFRIADENEMVVLKDEAIQSVLEEKYEESNKEFYNLVEIFSAGRDDKKLINTVLTLYNFIRSHPFPDIWLNEKLKLYDENINIKDTIFGKTLIEYALGAIEQCISLTQNSITLIEDDEKIKTAYGENLSFDMMSIVELKRLIEHESWNEISNYLKNLKLTTLKRLVGYADDPIKLKVTQNRQEIKNIIKKLTQIFYSDENQCRDDIKKLKPIINELFNLVRKFWTKLDEFKTEKSIVDFGDLEHLTLKLLVRPLGNGFEKTDIAKNLSEQFKYVMVDEYQDTNEAQDMIFRAISKNEDNLFVVGDVKQSIYRFRQAMPEIFLRRKESYKNFDRNNESYPAKIILDKNFRSRKGVLGATNFVFSQIMSKSMGEMEYTNEEKLVNGAFYEPRNIPDMSLDILDISDDENNMNVCEARHIAKIISEMIGSSYKIKDKDTYRPVTYGDFCILLRSANKHASEFVKELELCGIPAWSDTAGSFFGTVEVATVISMLRIIDNPIQDIPLISVLLSPIYGFTPDDLSEIRLCEKKVSLYFALKECADKGNVKCQNFLTDICNYRMLASTMPSDKLIQYFYDKSGYLSIIQSMKEGKLRLNNLRLLIEYARNYEAAGYRGLTGFIKFIDKLEEQKSDMSSANAISEGANVVKIMSIHRSKGLEFPICIVANCSRKFNKDMGDILLHPELGPGLRILDKDNMRKYTTIQREAIRIDIDRGAMSEELRVLYVAMTRAKEHLIMITSLKNPQSTLGKLVNQLTENNVISPYVIRSASSFSDWILLCALRHPDGKYLRDISGALPGIMIEDENRWNIDIVKPETNEADIQEVKSFDKEVIDNELLEKINSRINYKYRYSELSRLPTKITVSDLISTDKSSKFNFAKKPLFSLKKSMDAAQVGTALHTFMQFVNLKNAKENVENEINRLLNEGFISKEQCDAIDKNQIKRFLESDLCNRILNSNNVIREFRFTINISAKDVIKDINSEFSEEPVILQGAIDCAFEEDGKYIIVDYKTNKTKSSEFLTEQYSNQLKLYKKAFAKCTENVVSKTVLYSFYTGEEIFL